MEEQTLIPFPYFSHFVIQIHNSTQEKKQLNLFDYQAWLDKTYCPEGVELKLPQFNLPNGYDLFMLQMLQAPFTIDGVKHAVKNQESLKNVMRLQYKIFMGAFYSGPYVPYDWVEKYIKRNGGKDERNVLTEVNDPEFHFEAGAFSSMIIDIDPGEYIEYVFNVSSMVTLSIPKEILSTLFARFAADGRRIH